VARGDAPPPVASNDEATVQSSPVGVGGDDRRFGDVDGGGVAAAQTSDNRVYLAARRVPRALQLKQCAALVDRRVLSQLSVPASAHA
jgi:hypothetical protein